MRIDRYWDAEAGLDNPARVAEEAAVNRAWRECAADSVACDGSPAPAATTARRPHIVVGGGPAGSRAAQELARASERRVLLFNDEVWGPYNRVKLTPLLAREVNLGEVCQSLDLDTARRVERIDGRRILSIDRDARTVRDHHGQVWPYEKLILATGSRPHRPPIPGIELSGVFTFRSLNDAQALVARAQRSRHTVIIGGGLLGLEAARGMFGRGVPTTVVEHESRLMAMQLDQAGGDLLRREIQALGIGVRTGVAVQQIVGTLRVEAMFLSTGEEIACDTVILCTGVRPNRELAFEADLAVGRGVRVDARMQTTDPHIFAVGECAQHDGVVEGLVAPGLEQARVAAACAAGQDASYRRTPPTTRLKVVGAPVFSAGDVEQLDDRDDVETHTYASQADGRYRRLVVRKGRLVGAIAIGEWEEIGQVQQLLARQARVWPWGLWRFARTGRLVGEAMPPEVAAWPAAATVCNCTGVTRGQLGEVIAAGCTTADDLARATSASTVCGGCRPLLQELVAGKGSATARPEPATAWGALGVLSLLALLGGLAYGPLAPAPFSPGFSAGFTLDKLFIDGGLKQATGYGLIALAAAAGALSLRKRWPRLRLGDFAAWRLVHLSLGVLALTALAAHTGFRLGSNLNFALILCFLATLVAGALGGGAVALEHRLATWPLARRLAPRRLALWLHILALWPLPALLLVHVATVYFY